LEWAESRAKLIVELTKALEQARIAADQARIVEAEQKKKEEAERPRRERAAAAERARIAEEHRRIRAACSMIYKSTANRKISDLTVGEDQQVKACQAVGLYPPR